MANVDTLIKSSVAGIFISLGLNTTDYKHLIHAQEEGVPLIFFDRVPESIDAIKIVIDDFNGAYQATDHLIKMGYRRIAHFGGIDQINIYKLRKEGYLKALKDNGIPRDNSLIMKKTLTVDSGKEAMEKLMKGINPPDALFAASDYAALGAYTWLREQQIHVPDEFGIVGFGNEKFTNLIFPALSTVDQFSMKIGKFAAEFFFDGFVGNNDDEYESPKKVQLAAELIVRESSRKKHALVS